MKNIISKTALFLLGILMGCLLAGLMTQSMIATRRGYVFPPPTTVKTPRDFSESFPMDVSGYAGRDIATIAFAEERRGNVKEAMDMVLQNMDKFDAPEDQSVAYYVLAAGETDLGHPERALPYAEKSVNLAVRENNILLLARSYEYAKDFPKALATYQKLLELNNAESEIDREFLVARITALSQMLGTPAP